MHYTTRIMLMDAVRNLSRTIYNLISCARTHPSESNAALLRNLVLSMPQMEQKFFASECRFLKDMPLERLSLSTILFPYQVRCGEDVYALSKRDVEVGRDKGGPYVVHSSGRRVYFPKSTSEIAMLENYRGLMYAEGITGAGLLEKSPHCYQDADFSLEDGDCLLDLGCAEALFTIDNIDRVSKAVLFECESVWSKPLAATFRPYREKVHIIEKMVSGHTSKKAIRIMDAIDGVADDDQKFFVKMDIEGGERQVISGNEDFFREKKVKLSCCVYHRQDDAEVIKRKLEKLGYKTRFSDGFMLSDMNGIHYPYFRHGVIYARNY